MLSPRDGGHQESPTFRDEPAEVRAHRVEAIRRLLAHAATRSPFHRERFESVGFEPGDLRDLEDLRGLPVMTKDDLRLHHAGLSTVPPHETREIFTTSGTTGEPVVFRYRQEDLARLARQGADLLAVAGVSPGDVFQLTLPLGAAMWIAGLDFWMSFQARGAGTVRYGPGDSAGQLDTIRSLGVDGIFLTASFALRLGQVAREAGVTDALPVRKLLVVNENILDRDLGRNELGKQLHELWPGRTIRAVYGNTELGFSGAECEGGRGYHTHGEAHYFEVLDPTTGEPLCDGEPGRLVVTSMKYFGLPLIRYAIDDVTFVMREPCSCGRTSDRMGPILGRLDQLIKVKGGTSVYPPAIENVLISDPRVEEYLVEARLDSAGRQVLRIHLALAQEAEHGSTVDAIRDLFSQRFHFRPDIRVLARGEIEKRIHVPGKRKPARFQDHRAPR